MKPLKKRLFFATPDRSGYESANVKFGKTYQAQRGREIGRI